MAGKDFYLDNVEISASAGNLPPFAVDDTDTTLVDVPVTIDVLVNDSDPDLDGLTVDSVTQGSTGSVTNNSSDVTYTPDPAWTGFDTFSYTVTDGNGEFDTALVTVATKPIVYRDEFNARAYDGDDGTVPWASDWYESGGSSPLIGGRRVDADGAELYVLMFADSTPSEYVERTADLSVLSNAELTFEYRQHFMTPAVGFEVQISEDGSNWDTVWTMWGSGSDGSYVPVIVDLSAYNAAPTTIRFTHVAGTPAGFIFHVDNVQIAETANDPPVAVDDSDGTLEDAAVTVDVLGNDSDPNGDGLLIGAVTQGGNGSVTDNDSDVTYTPNQHWNGIDTFTYTISDGSGGFDTATVTVTVSAEPDPPVAVDDTDSTLEDSPVAVDVLANDSDPDGDPVSITAVTQGSNGSVTNNSSDVTYTPDPGWNGIDTFSYTIGDGNGGFDTAAVTVTVSSTNVDPLAVDDADSTLEDTPITIDVLGNDTDADLDPLVVDSVTQGGNGSVTDNDSDVTYTPNQHWNGIDTFTYTISDGQGGTSSATVTVTVTPVNDDPLGVADSASTFEDTPVGVDVLANDSDVDSSALTITAVSNGTNGTVTTDGLTVTYTPDLNWSGTDTFTYRVSDDLGGWCETDVTVTVTPVNDDPVAVDDVAAVVQDTPVNIWVLDNDSDPDLDSLSVSAVTNGAHGTVVNHGIKVTYTPAPGRAGIDSFTYTVTDGNDRFDTAQVTVTVTGIPPTNQLPVAKDDGVSTDEDVAVTVAPLANDSDPDGDAVTVSAVNQGAHGSVTMTATTITYTPAKDWSGIDSFSYSITDGRGGTAAAAVVVTVKPVNDPPVARDDNSSTMQGDLVTVPVLANDSDVDGDGLTVATIAPGSHGATTTDGITVTYSPSPGWSGTDSFAYTVTDGRGGFADAAVTVTVAAANTTIDPATVVPVSPKNQPPVITVIGDPAAEKGTRLKLEVNAEDPDGDGVSISASGLPGWLSLIDFGAGRASLSGVPWSGADPSTEITISASDGTVTAQVVVTIEVVDGNRPPLIRPISFNGVNDDGSFSFAISSSDPDGDPLAISAGGLPPWANLTDHGDGTATISSNGVPNDAIGSFSVVVSVTDGMATVTSSLSRSIADLRLGLPAELTHQAFGTDGTDTLVATALKPRVATPDPLGAHLTPREGLSVAFGSAVETMKNQILPALVLGVVMAWMLMIGVGRTKEEEEPEVA